MRLLIKSKKSALFTVFVVGWALLSGGEFAFADPPVMTYRTVTVAIDPGHGGRDHGAQGPTGLIEKTVVLELARQLALELEPDYHVVLTRSDDYHVDLHQRTAIANNAKADLMISLHTGGGFRHTMKGRTIYYHAVRSGDAKPPIIEKGTQDQHPWHQVQAKHAQTSQILANVLKSQFDLASASVPCHLQEASLVVLQGADMPAVLIELGYITHPDTEKELISDEGIALLIKAIHQGIDLFLKP